MGVRNYFQYSSLKAFLILEILALLIVSYQIQVAPKTSLLDQVGLTLLAPFQLFARNTADFFFGAMESKRDVVELRTALNKLEERLRTQKGLEYELKEIKRENLRLRGILNIKPRQGWKTIASEVVGKSNKFGDSIFIINCGTQDGLYQDLGVICDQGVVGVLWQVGPLSSKVVTLRNPSAVVAAMTKESSYLDAYSLGTGEPKGRLENVPNFEHVGIAEKILTSGLDGLFPRGLILGTVAERKKTNQMFQEIFLNFEVDFSRVEHVQILIPEEREEGAQ